MLSAFQARQMDESAFFVLDTAENTLHGADGGPFPYRSKATAFSVVARRNGRTARTRRFVVVTWINLKPVR
jgi:ribosomal protein S10